MLAIRSRKIRIAFEGPNSDYMLDCYRRWEPFPCTLAGIMVLRSDTGMLPVETARDGLPVWELDVVAA